MFQFYIVFLCDFRESSNAILSLNIENEKILENIVLFGKILMIRKIINLKKKNILKFN